MPLMACSGELGKASTPFFHLMCSEMEEQTQKPLDHSGAIAVARWNYQYYISIEGDGTSDFDPNESLGCRRVPLT